MRVLNEIKVPEEFAQRLAELTAELAALARRIELIEGERGSGPLAQPTDLTIHSYDDDENSIQLLTENGFVIVRPWETDNLLVPDGGTFRFRVQDCEGIDREIRVEISSQLLRETAWRTGGRIERSNHFWVSCAERRLANYLMEQGEFPPANEILIENLGPEDVMLAIRWEKST